LSRSAAWILARRCADYQDAIGFASDRAIDAFLSLRAAVVARRL
jgi:hypothetical protein